MPFDESWGVLHVLAWQRNYVVNTQQQLAKSKVEATTIKEHKDLLGSAADKIKAVLTLILGGDKQAAEYTLTAIISRIYKKESLFLIGNIPLNLTGVTQTQSKLLQKFLL